MFFFTISRASFTCVIQALPDSFTHNFFHFSSFLLLPTFEGVSLLREFERNFNLIVMSSATG